jgi:fructosamine-3-kinase
VLEAEAAGLEALREARALRVPRVFGLRKLGDETVLEIEWIERGTRGERSDATLGRGLAIQHAYTAQRFGWHRTGTIGRTIQINDWCGNWAEFFAQRRLRPQFDLLTSRGCHIAEAPRMLAAVAVLLAGHSPSASLLHGDLWGGNWLAARDGTPVVFDPSVYFGDRETDLAMTELFGGFGRGFREAYESQWPLPAGHAVRSRLYALYHLLNHANLFGGDYLAQSRRSIAGLLAHCAG